MTEFVRSLTIADDPDGCDVEGCVQSASFRLTVEGRRLDLCDQCADDTLRAIFEEEKEKHGD